jgi:zinc protease
MSGATPRRFLAENGTRFIIKENHSTPIISLYAEFLGGVRMERAHLSGITNLMQRLLLKGTQNRSAEEIANQLEFLGTTIFPFTGKDIFGMSMSILSRHFSKGLEIFTDCMLNPIFDENEVEKEKCNILLEIEKKKDDNLGYCFEMCEGLLFRRHPYRLPLLGLENTVQRLTRQDLVAWHRRYYNPERMVVSMVGDIKARDAYRLLQNAFGGFRTKRAPLFLPHREPPLVSPRSRLKKREKRQVVISLGFFAPPLLSDEMYVFDVLNHVLAGMGSRLFIELRDKKGLAYVVSSSYDPRLDSGVFRAYIGTSLEQKDGAVEALLEELRKIRDRRVPDEELSRTKRYMLGLNEISLQRNSSQASRYAYYELTGLGYEALHRYAQRIKKVTAKQLQEVARRYIDVDNYALALVIPKG